MAFDTHVTWTLKSIFYKATAWAIVNIPGKSGQGYYVQLTAGFCVHVYSTLSTSNVAMQNSSN